MKHSLSASLKANARENLLGRYGLCSLTFILIQLITLGLSFLVETVSDTSNTTGLILFIVITLIMEMFVYIFVIGEASIYLKLACGMEAKISDILNGYKGHPDKIIQLVILVFCKVIIWFVPGIIATVGYLLKGDYLFLALGGLLLIVGTIGGYNVAIDYSQTEFILLDYPELNALQIMKISKDMMIGNKGSYLYLVFSFIPMYILTALSFGIGMLYVYPYTRMTMTEYYLELADKNRI